MKRIEGALRRGRNAVWRTAVKHMGEGASVINIGSAATRLNTPNGSVYTATKAAVDSITYVLAKELGPRRIRVNSVSPGFTSTEGTSAYMGSDLVNMFVASTPLGRVGEPSDIAAVAVFLASDDARWLTGQILFASGGLGV